ncbi:MAG TPA: amino acid ABC transporter permease [Bacilli bacterium]|nr:amino acid ABC transporter permease [Bacilli bacterium]
MPSGFFPGVFYLLKRHYPIFLSGVMVTITISMLGTMFGFVIGLFLATLRLLPSSKPRNRIVRIITKLGAVISKIYVQVFRGTPMIVQATVIYYGVLALFGYWSAFVAGIVVVSLNTAAYMAEIIRGGVTSIDKGQTEAGLAIGLTYWQTLRHIVFPQALKHAIPAFGNELIVNIKDTSVLSVIAVSDLFFSSKFIITNNFRPFEVYFIISVIYLVLTLSMSALLRRLEKGIGLRVRYSPPSSQTVPEVMGEISDE